MQLPKLKVLAEAGAVCDIEVNHDAAMSGWTVQVSRPEAVGYRAGSVRVVVS